MRKMLEVLEIAGLVLGLAVVGTSLVRAAGSSGKVQLFSFSYQAAGEPSDPGTAPGVQDLLELWSQEPPDTAWTLQLSTPLEKSGTLSLWVGGLTRVRARTVRVLAEIAPDGLGLPGSPERRLYSGWSNELRFLSQGQTHTSPPPAHIRVP